jgi:hypothetical protein
LDPRNPRLPTEFRNADSSQREIALHINREYDPLSIAESISRHRFFESEPLIAVRSGSAFTVIEGNRRLTALLGLSDDALRAEFASENSGWRKLDTSNVPTSVPVLVVKHPEEVAPLLGFRHISGIEPWEPYAQARFIFELVESGNTLSEVAELVGRSATEVKSKYRDYEVLRQAEEQFGLQIERARDAFGVFNNAMTRRGIRDFISAPDPRSVDPDFWPLPDSSKKKLATLLVLIFGRAKGEGRVITDSRQLADLSKVLADKSGRALSVLLATRELSEALDEIADPEEQFSRAIAQAHRAMRKAEALEGSVVAESSRGRLQTIRRIADALLNDAADGGKE